MSIVVALEGGVCSGKSSVCRLLERDGIAAQCRDYMDMITDRNAEEISELPPLERAAIFLDLDSHRLSLVAQSSLPLVLDRCALTVFAFEFACVRANYNSAEPRLTELVSTYKLVQPDAITFLDVSDALRNKREESRQNRVLPRLVDPQFNAAIREFFQKTATLVPTQFLNSGQNSPEEIAQKVEEQIALSKVSVKTAPFWQPLLSWAFE